MRRCLATTVVGCLCLVRLAAGPELTFAQRESLPPEVRALAARKLIETSYELSSHLNPFYVQGDFDGDGRVDTAGLPRKSAATRTKLASDPTIRNI